ncbi:NAD-dependent DNA ligase LigA [bacterium]|nr:NAD-dependent DNA ligase LigA [bacterium]
MIDVLQMWGFKTAPGVSAETLKEVAGFFEEMGAERTKLDFWIDGVVIRVDDTRLFADLGVVGKTPRGLVAWKFPPEEATTRVESVEWFVGRTGALTPVATVTPTFVAGTTVTHATLHNADEIGRLDVRVGDTVILTKAGDIIPKILKVLPELRTGKEEKLEMPKKCPVCDSDVTRRSGEVALVCTNSNCYAMERERVLHAARAFAIDGLGEKIVEKLLNAGLVKIAPDIFTLTKDDLLTVEGFAEISAQKLVDEIQARKEIELEDFIVALGIRHVGAETAFVLATSFGNMQFLAQASAEELAQVSEIGPVVAESIASFFADPHSKKLLLEYERGGVVIKKAKAIKRILEGRTFVITGTLASLGREAAKDKVRLLGGSVSESVSKNTTYVVVGENPGSKADKARELGVAILSEADFLTMIQE